MITKAEGRHRGNGKRPFRGALSASAIYHGQTEKANILPRFNPLVRIGIDRFITEIGTAEFYSRQFNIVLPELLIEALWIEREERP